MTPRSCLRWKPTGRIFSNVHLRWVPTGRLFNYCTGKVDSEPTHGSNVDIPHIHACKQTLGLSAGETSARNGFTNDEILSMMFGHSSSASVQIRSVFMEGDAVHISSGTRFSSNDFLIIRSELTITPQHDRQGYIRLVPKVVPLAFKTTTSTTRVELLCHPSYSNA
ncbi:hypothetical protein Tco_1385912 [Tanacetum coccineum]